MLKTSIACVILAVLLPRPALADPAPRSATIQGSDDRAVGRLPNGLNYLVEHRSGAKTSVLLYVKAGSQAEAPTEADVAHMIEHLAFNETRNLPRGEFRRLLDRTGVSHSGNTGPYNTSFMMDIPAHAQMGSAVAARVLRDWADGIVIDGRTVALERNVMRSEAGPWDDWRAIVEARFRVQDMFVGTFWAETPERFSSLRVPVEQVQAFYRRWYRPELMQVVVVGDIDVDEWVHAIRSEMTSIRDRSGSAVAPPRIKPLSPPKAQRITLIRAPAPSANIVETFLMRPAPLVTSQEDMVRQELRSLLALGVLKHRASRFGDDAILVNVNDDQRFTQIRRSNVVGLSTAPDAVSLADLTKHEELIQEMRDFNVTHGELELAKRAALKEIDKYADTAPVIVRGYAETLAQGLELDASSRPIDRALKHRLLAALTLQDVQDFVTTMFSTEPRTVITAFEPEKQGIDPGVLQRALSSRHPEAPPRPQPVPDQPEAFEPLSAKLPGESGGRAPMPIWQELQTLILPGGHMLVLSAITEPDMESGPVMKAIGDLSLTAGAELLFSGPVEIRPASVSDDQLRALIKQYEISASVSVSGRRGVLTLKGGPGSERALFALMRAITLAPSNLTPLNPAAWKASVAGRAVIERERIGLAQRHLEGWSPKLYLLSGSVTLQQAAKWALGNLVDPGAAGERKCALPTDVPRAEVTPATGSGDDEVRRVLSASVARKPDGACLKLLQGVVSRMLLQELRMKRGLAYAPSLSLDVREEPGERYRVALSLSTQASAGTRDGIDEGIMQVIRAVAAGNLDMEIFQAEKAKHLRALLGPPGRRSMAVDELEGMLLDQRVPQRFADGYFTDSVQYGDLATMARQLFAGLP